MGRSGALVSGDSQEEEMVNEIKREKRALQSAKAKRQQEMQQLARARVERDAEEEGRGIGQVTDEDAGED